MESGVERAALESNVDVATPANAYGVTAMGSRSLWSSAETGVRVIFGRVQSGRGQASGTSFTLTML